MNRFPCPSCGRALRWNGIKVSDRQFNTEGKRWFQFAGPVIHCKYCGVRLQPPYEGAMTWVFAFVLVNALLIQPFLIEPLKAEYGLGVVIGYLALIVSLAVVLWLRGRYRIWEPPPSGSEPSSDKK